MIPEEFNEVAGERMGVLVGGPEDGHRFPIARVLCDCCAGPATHYACKYEDGNAYSVYRLDEASILMFSDVRYHFDHYETEQSEDWIELDPMESED